jgi:hypothetical protein
VHLCVLRDSHYNTMYFYKQLTSVFISIEKTLFFEKYAINLNMLGYRLETYKNLSSFDHHIPKLTMRNHSTLRNKIVKWSRYRPDVAQRVGRGIALLFHDRGTRRRWVVSSTPQPHFTPGKYPVPILQEAGWAPGPVWTGGKSRPHQDSIPDRPARSQSLYRPTHLGTVTANSETRKPTF